MENMGPLKCPHCGEQIHLFGKDGGEEFARNMEIPFLGRIPFDIRVNQAADEGVTLLRRYPESGAAEAFRSIAGRVKQEIEGKPDGHQ